MKLGLLGDLHLTNRSPIMRIDDYWQTLLGKLSEALLIFEEHKCDAIIQVGDFFDASTVANRVKAQIINLFKTQVQSQIPVYCVFGQHDIDGHSKSTLPNSPLAVLEAAGALKILDEKGHKWVFHSKGKQCILYGASFGEEIPKPENSKAYNILVTHHMIGDRQLWPGQELRGPRSFLRSNPNYDLIVCGDYHYRFIDSVDGRTIVNPGAIVRKTRIEFDLAHEPAVVIFDTNTHDCKIVKLTIKSIEEVFDLVKVEKKGSGSLLKLIESLKDRSEKTVGWKQILVNVLAERNSSKGARKVIDESLEKIKCPT